MSDNFFLFCFSNFHAGNEEFRTEFKVPPFQDCVLSFLGFSEEEKTNMEERTQKHGTELSCISVLSETSLKYFNMSQNLRSNNSLLTIAFHSDATETPGRSSVFFYIARPFLLKQMTPDFCLRGIFKGVRTACFVQVDGSRQWVMKGAPTW